jgi:autotransporter-associated beta strand protein
MSAAKPEVASAASFTWTGFAPSDEWDAVILGPGTTNWNTGGDTTQIPDSNDTATFNSSSVGAITVDLNGTRRVQSFTLTGSQPINLTTSADVLELGFGDLTASASANTFLIQSNVRLFGQGDWNVSQTGGTPALDVTGVISQSGGIFGITKSGNGTLILSGNNTYTGSTTISSGTLQIGNGGAPGSVAGNINNSGTLVFNRGLAFTYSGFISGTGSVVKQGANTLILTSNQSYTGGTTISSGTLQLGNGGTAGSIAGDVVNNASLIVNRSNNLSFSGAISGSGSLTKQGGGTLTLTGANTYGGATAISGGSLSIGDGGTSGSITGSIAVNSGNLIFNRSNDLTYGGSISGSGAVTKAGSGVLTLGGSNSYAGGTTLAGGTLSIANDGNLGNLSGDVAAEGGHLRVTSTHFTPRDFTLTDGLNIEVVLSATYTLNGLILGSEPLTKLGSGTLVINGNNVDVNDKVVQAGTLQIGSGGSSGVLTGNVLNNATLTFNRSDDVNYGGTISGTGTLVKQGAGKLTLSGTNFYSGTTQIGNGTLQISSDANLGAGPLLIQGSTLQVAATHSSIRPVSIQGSAVMEIDDGVVYSANGPISSTGNLVKSGPGRLVLSGNNFYAGSTSVTNGILSIAADNNLGSSGGGVTISDATLQVTGSHSTNRDFSLVGNAEFEIVGGITYAINGHVGSSGSLIKNGGGTLSLSDVNSYSGGTIVNSGTLAVDSLNVLSTGDLMIAGGSVAVAGAAVIGQLGTSGPSNVSIDGGDLTTAADRDTTIGAQGLVSMNAGVVNTRRLNILFDGRLIGSGDVDAAILADTGSAMMAAADLSLGDASAVNGFYSNGDLNVVAGTTTLRDANTAVFDSAAYVSLGDGVGGSASLAAANGMTLDFGSNLTGFGSVDTPNDPLKPFVNNGHIEGDSGAEPITLIGYVKGVGTMNNVVITGTNAPGFSPATVNYGNVEYAGTLEIELAGLGAGNFDKIVHTGIAELGGTLDVALISGFVPALGDTFEILTATGGISGTFDTEVLPALTGNLMLDVVYGANTVSLAALLPGDFNVDGNVDAADYVLWRKNDGTPQGYDAWRANFGATAGGGSAGDALAGATVPEPASAVLLLAAAFAAGYALRLRNSGAKPRCPRTLHASLGG